LKSNLSRNENGVNQDQDAHIVALLLESRSQEQGFRLLLQQYQQPLYWHVRRMVLNHDDANDVVQNVLIKVYRNIATFEGKSKLYTWLYRIATNESITFLNNRQRRGIQSIDQDVGFADNLRADTYFDGNETQIVLQKAIATLPEKQRIVFNMRYFGEHSYAQMSEILDTSEGALKASFHHAVKKIELFVQAHE
jgi:RNA polymerase sigma factor (sigma-70 family)